MLPQYNLTRSSQVVLFLFTSTQFRVQQQPHQPPSLHRHSICTVVPNPAVLRQTPCLLLCLALSAKITLPWKELALRLPRNASGSQELLHSLGNFLARVWNVIYGTDRVSTREEGKARPSQLSAGLGGSGVPAMVQAGGPPSGEGEGVSASRAPQCGGGRGGCFQRWYSVDTTAMPSQPNGLAGGLSGSLKETLGLLGLAAGTAGFRPDSASRAGRRPKEAMERLGVTHAATGLRSLNRWGSQGSLGRSAAQGSRPLCNYRGFFSTLARHSS